MSSQKKKENFDLFREYSLNKSKFFFLFYELTKVFFFYRTHPCLHFFLFELPTNYLMLLQQITSCFKNYEFVFVAKLWNLYEFEVLKFTLSIKLCIKLCFFVDVELCCKKQAKKSCFWGKLWVQREHSILFFAKKNSKNGLCTKRFSFFFARLCKLRLGEKKLFVQRPFFWTFF